MAEAVKGLVRGRIEPPGRTRNRRRNFERRMTEARTTAEQIQAAVDYFSGSFAHCSPSEIDQLCRNLADYTDSERGRLRDSREHRQP